MADNSNISFRPTDRDIEAIELHKAFHPFLVSTSDVLRFALHMSAQQIRALPDVPEIDEPAIKSIDEIDPSILLPEQQALLARVKNMKAKIKQTKGK